MVGAHRVRPKYDIDISIKLRCSLSLITDYCLLITERPPVSTRKLILHDYLPLSNRKLSHNTLDILWITKVATNPDDRDTIEWFFLIPPLPFLEVPNLIRCEFYWHQ
jgi:hypothetical protein